MGADEGDLMWCWGVIWVAIVGRRTFQLPLIFLLLLSSAFFDAEEVLPPRLVDHDRATVLQVALGSMGTFAMPLRTSHNLGEGKTCLTRIRPSFGRRMARLQGILGARRMLGQYGFNTGCHIKRHGRFPNQTKNQKK